MIGMRTAGIQAPSVNFETTTTSATTPVVKRPTPLMTALTRQFGSFSRKWCTHHAGLAEGEPGEHPERVQRDQGADVALEDDDQDAGHDGEEDDAVREHEPVATVGELPGRKPSRAMIDDRRGKSA